MYICEEDAVEKQGSPSAEKSSELKNCRFLLPFYNFCVILLFLPGTRVGEERILFTIYFVWVWAKDGDGISDRGLGKGGVKTGNWGKGSGWGR